MSTEVNEPTELDSSNPDGGGMTGMSAMAAGGKGETPPPVELASSNPTPSPVTDTTATPDTPSGGGSGPDHSGKILWEGAPSVATPGLDFKNGKAFATVVLPVEVRKDGKATVENKNYLVTPDRKLSLITPAMLRKHGITFRDGVPFEGCNRWSLMGIRRFLRGFTPSPVEVFRRIAENLIHFLDFPPVRTHKGEISSAVVSWLMSLITMTTWFKSVFAAIGYLHLNAAKGSGKTKAQRLLSRCTYLGEVVLPTTTAAAMKHLANIGCSLLLDEMEMISKKDFDPDKRAILLSGNTAGSFVWLMEPIGDKWVPRQLGTYGFRSFSNISEIDDVLGDRMITVRMARSSRPEISNRDPEIDAAPTPWQEIVDDLYCLSLLHMGEVQSIYEKLTSDQFWGREWQIWRPIFSLAKWIDSHAAKAGEQPCLYDAMVGMALAKRIEKQFAQDPGLDYWVLRAVVALLHEKGDLSEGVYPQELRDKLEQLNPDLIKTVVKTINGEEKETKEHIVELYRLGRIVRQLQILDTIRPDGGVQRSADARRYFFSPVTVRERALSYGIECVPYKGSPLDEGLSQADADGDSE